MTRLQYLEMIEALPVLDLTQVYNPGAAFSFLAGESGWQRWLLRGACATMPAVVILGRRHEDALERTRSGCSRARWSALTLGGAASSVMLIPTASRLGHVVDFAHVPTGVRFVPGIQRGGRRHQYVGAVSCCSSTRSSKRGAQAARVRAVKADNNSRRPDEVPARGQSPRLRAGVDRAIDIVVERALELFRAAHLRALMKSYTTR